MRETSVYAVASGKGGVGKSVLSVLLSAGFSRTGRRVLLVDGSAGEGCLHLLLGIRPPAEDDASTSEPGGPDVRPVRVAEDLWFLTSDSAAGCRAAPDPMERARAHLRMTGCFDQFDTVLIDAGPGIDAALRATIRCSRLLVVAVPEPASLYSAYALIKAVVANVPDLPCDLVVNRIGEEAEALRAYGILDFACRRYLGRRLRFRGAVPERPALRRAVQTPGRLLREEIDEIEAVVRSFVNAGEPLSEIEGRGPAAQTGMSSCCP